MIKNVFLVFLLSSMLTIVLAACNGENTETSGNESNENLVMADFGGVYAEAKEASIEKFEEENDIEITIVTPPDAARLIAMVDSGDVEWDIVVLEGMIAEGLSNDGYLEKLDYELINTDGLVDEAVHEYSVTHDFIKNVPSFNTNSISSGDHPKNYEEFWDTERFPEGRTLNRRPVGLLEQALLADGVDKNDLYPLDVDRAFESLDKIKDHVISWGDSAGQVIELLSQNEAPMAITTVGRVIDAQNEGVNVDFDSSQGIILDDRLMIPKGSSNSELAMKFIDFMLQPEQQADFISKYASEPANADALDLLSEEELEAIGIDVEGTDDDIYIDNSWWADNFEGVNDRMLEWLIE